MKFLNMNFLHMRFLAVKFVLIAVGALALIGGARPASAAAHCFCKIAGWQSSPVASVSGVVKDFGQIATYNTQVGHDNQCQSLCTTTANSHFTGLGASGQAALCAGHSLYGYYAVGTKKYQGAGELPCPAVGAPKLWLHNQIPSGQNATVIIGINRTLLPSNKPLRVCIRNSQLSEACYAAPGTSSSTAAQVNFPNVPRNANYRISVKRKMNTGPLYVVITHIDVHVN